MLLLALTPCFNLSSAHNQVVIELIIAFATGAGCFIFSLNLFRRLSKGDEEAAGAMASMLHVHEGDYEDEGDDEGSAFGDEAEGPEVEEEGGVGESKEAGRRRRAGKRRAAKGDGTGIRRRGAPGMVAGTGGSGGGGGQYQTFRRIFSSPTRGQAPVVGGGGDASRGAVEPGGAGGGGSSSGGGGGLVGSVTGAMRSAVGYLKFW